MNSFIHISVLAIYLFSSSLLVGTNRLIVSEDNQTFASKLIDMMTFSISDYTDNNDTELPLLFKDPTEDTAIVLDYFPADVTLCFQTIQLSGNLEEKIKDPFRNIFSPPPQLI